MYRSYSYFPHDQRLEIVSHDLATIDPAEPNPLLPVLTGQFGEDFVPEVVSRMTGTTLNDAPTARDKLSNCVGYLMARTCMEDPHGDLVANLGPDEAWHTFILYMEEYDAFCRRIAGDMLHHDPAGESALVNNEEATKKTLGLFQKHGIPYTPALWQDHITYPNGAEAVRSGFRRRTAARVSGSLASSSLHHAE